MKTNKVSIYLIKEGISDETAILKTVLPNKKIVVNDIGHFHFDSSPQRKPSWLADFFNDTLDVAIFQSSAKGLLLISILHDSKVIWFALCFGTGRHMLKDGVIEERFGLKVTLNSVLPESIRSLEKRTLGAVSKISREQMSKAGKASDFGIDIEQDLLRAVTGTSRFSTLGKIVSGADALNASAKVDLSSIKEFLKYAYTRYLSTDYQSEFGWIDQIKEIKEGLIKDSLNNTLIEKFNSRDIDKIWMAVPELIDWSDLKGFKYVPRQEELHSDIDIGPFLDSFSDKIDSIENIKSRNVIAYSSSTDEEMESWSAYKCIYGEVELNHKQYIINNGKWYEINNDFVKQIEKSYNEIPLSTIDLPDYNHNSEGDYTAKITSGSQNLLLMDRKMIYHGGGRSQVEFCDIFTKDNKLIHIKPYGSSSILSHLFQQGLVSGELFVSDAEFRKKLNKMLSPGWKLSNSSAKIIPSTYEIIYAIISNKDVERPNIPFFSKVSIKNAKRRLEAFGYKVALKRIKSEKK